MRVVERYFIRFQKAAVLVLRPVYGGAITDLRPYVAKLDWKVGIGTEHIQDASYPFLIQEKYRAGYFTHYAGEGTVRSAKLTYQGEEVDLCLCPTHAHFSQEGNTRILTLDPVDLVFTDLTIKLQTKIFFTEGSADIRIERTILHMSNPDAELELNEYMVACYGTTEYSEDMSGITLSAVKGADTVTLPYVREGYAFSPMFTLGYQTKISDKEVISTWLSLEKAN